MVSTDHVAKSVPNRTSAKKIHVGCLLLQPTFSKNYNDKGVQS